MLLLNWTTIFIDAPVRDIKYSNVDEYCSYLKKWYTLKFKLYLFKIQIIIYKVLFSVAEQVNVLKKDNESWPSKKPRVSCWFNNG